MIYEKFLGAIYVFSAFLLARKLFPDVMPSKYTLDYAHYAFRISYMQETRKIINSSREILKETTKILISLYKSSINYSCLNKILRYLYNSA